MNYIKLNEEEMEETKCGAALTLAAVIAIFSAAILAVVIYKIFTSTSGSTTLPGGYKFTWN